MYVLLAVFKKKLSVEATIGDIEQDTISDFSIMVTYLPKSATREEIKNFFQDNFKVHVVKISLAYNVEELCHIEDEIVHVEEKLIYLKHHEEDNPENRDKIKKKQEKIAHLKHEAADIKKSFTTDHEKHFTGIAYISFKHMHEADKITNKFEIGATRWLFNKCQYKLRFKGKFDLSR